MIIQTSVARVWASRVSPHRWHKFHRGGSVKTEVVRGERNIWDSRCQGVRACQSADDRQLRFGDSRNLHTFACICINSVISIASHKARSTVA